MRKKIIYLLLLLICLPMCMLAQSKSTFEIKDGHFYRNGKVTLFFQEKCIMPESLISIGVIACK